MKAKLQKSFHLLAVQSQDCFNNKEQVKRINNIVFVSYDLNLKAFLRPDMFFLLAFPLSRYRGYVCSVAIYQKYLTRLGELIIFLPWRENYHFSQPS